MVFIESLFKTPSKKVEIVEIKTKTGLENFVYKYTLSFLAASCAEFGIYLVTQLILTLLLINNFFYLVTYPLDLTKTRLQIQGEKELNKYNVENQSKLKQIKYRGMTKTAIGIGMSLNYFSLFTKSKVIFDMI